MKLPVVSVSFVGGKEGQLPSIISISAKGIIMKAITWPTFEFRGTQKKNQSDLFHAD
jgi:hypothetical protein